MDDLRMKNGDVPVRKLLVIYKRVCVVSIAETVVFPDQNHL